MKVIDVFVIAGDFVFILTYQDMRLSAGVQFVFIYLLHLELVHQMCNSAPRQ
jgi:hypothetical protein